MLCWRRGVRGTICGGHTACGGERYSGNLAASGDEGTVVRLLMVGPMNLSITHQDYELAVLEKLRLELLPHGIPVLGTENGRVHEVEGRYSRVPRQLDAAAYRPGESRPFLIADAKRHGRPIDVKEAEAFIGMLDDVGAAIGQLVAPQGFTAGAERRVEAASTYIRIMTIDEALTFKWLPVARLVYPQDWNFRKELALALRSLREGAPSSAVVDALDLVSFEEWDALVQYALDQHAAEAVAFLRAIASHHEDDGWRYHAIRHLIESGNLDQNTAAQLRERELDPEIRELLNTEP